MRIAVCDDEAAAREQIRRLISVQEAEAEICEYESGEALLAAGMDHDIIFLDVKMEGADGIRTAAELRRRGERPEIIFVTGLEEHVYEAFDVGAFHYLLKPVDKAKFLQVLLKAMDKCREKRELDSRLTGAGGGQPPAAIAVKTREGYQRVLTGDIMLAEVYNRKIKLYTQGGVIEYYGRLSALEQELGGGFFRCHRAYLINLGCVRRYDSESILLDDGTQVLLSRQKYSAFVKAYLHFIKRMEGV